MKDRKVNEDIRQELLVPPLSDMTDPCRRQWSGHVQKCLIPGFHGTSTNIDQKEREVHVDCSSDGQLCKGRTSVFGLLTAR